ncbi:hypothetical protein [Streptomyces filamentosus]|nr:hypothetical protein [Streptomyces filamentosus]
MSMELKPLRPLPVAVEADGETLADMGVADPPHEPDVVPPPDETA